MFCITREFSMVRPRLSVPTYRKHSTGRAVVSVYTAHGTRKEILLPGQHGSQESKEEYARVLKQLEAHNGRLPSDHLASDRDTTDGTATAGSDYQAASGTLTISAGQTTGTITVLVNGDRLGEPNETFVVNLSAPTNALIADGQSVGTIVDDEPHISIGDTTVT